MFININVEFLQSFIKNSKNLMQSWNLAVEEADNLLKLDGYNFNLYKTVKLNVFKTVKTNK